MQLKDIYQIDDIVDKMEQYVPQSKPKTGRPPIPYKQIATEWLEQVPRLMNEYSWDHEEISNWKHLNIKKVREQFQYHSKKNGNRFRWFTWLHENYPLWKEIHKGNNMTGKVSLVEFTVDDYEAYSHKEFGSMFHEYIEQLADTNFNEYADEGGEIKFISQKYDIASLLNYIEDTESNLNNGRYRNTSEKETMLQNVTTAYKILAISDPQQTEDVTYLNDVVVTYGYFPVAVRKSHFGREYHLGLNLQNCHKLVRHAALGNCVSIDISTSVFAFYKWFYEDYMFEGEKVPYALDLMLENKNRFRETIANDIKEEGDYFEPLLKKVKSGITAIGFGARSGSYTVALNDIFSYKSKTTGKPIVLKRQLDAFINHPHIKELSQMADKFKEEIRSWYKNDPEFKTLVQEVIEKAYDKKQQRVNYSRILAYFYQQAENSYRDKMIEIATNWHGGEIILQTHDGIYITGASEKIDLAKNMVYELQKLNRHLKVEVDTINAFNIKVATFDEKEAAKEIKEHHARMAEHENLAKGYKSSFVNSMKPKSSKEKLQETFISDYVGEVSGLNDRELERQYELYLQASQS